MCIYVGYIGAGRDVWSGLGVTMLVGNGVGQSIWVNSTFLCVNWEWRRGVFWGSQPCHCILHTCVARFVTDSWLSCERSSYFWRGVDITVFLKLSHYKIFLISSGCYCVLHRFLFHCTSVMFVNVASSLLCTRRYIVCGRYPSSLSIKPYELPKYCTNLHIKSFIIQSLYLYIWFFF